MVQEFADGFLLTLSNGSPETLLGDWYILKGYYFEHGWRRSGANIFFCEGIENKVSLQVIMIHNLIVSTFPSIFKKE